MFQQMQHEDPWTAVYKELSGKALRPREPERHPEKQADAQKPVQDE
jgi:hypothetical protein